VLRYSPHHPVAQSLPDPLPHSPLTLSLTHSPPEMQDTRLTRLLNGTLGQFDQWLLNPWRRISLVVMSLLLGNFLAGAVATTAGATSEWDVLAAMVIVAVTEAISWFVYWRRRSQLVNGRPRPSIVSEMLNAMKIGLTYGLFLEAFKLGS